ncbi:MAG: ATP synthase F1 subunit gamma [Candidatus Hydrogenedentes bacterium]|nr:ATP synthase F1 subunit gamma [Candidatus Hydrogenedentota bacterium]
MANLRDIKRRITSVKSTQKITKAMKMVAASKLRRAQASILQARPYAFHMRDLVINITRCATLDAHPLLSHGNPDRIGIIVVNSDKGLCGGFNATIVNRALYAIRKDFAGKEVDLTVVGRKGLDTLKRHSVTIRQNFTGMSDEPLALSKSVISDIAADYALGKTGEVYCVYNEFKSAVQQNVTVERLLPFQPEEDDGENVNTLDYLYEPSQEAIFESLLLRNLETQMHRILLESTASEFGARMTAMDAATRNAGEVIDKLTLQYNRARQNDITTQLIEVISGAEAL